MEVEFARELVEIARLDLLKAGIANAVVEHADATEVNLPDSDSIVHLYNPFSQEVMREVVAKLRESRSRRLYVIYNVPEVPNFWI